MSLLRPGAVRAQRRGRYAGAVNRPDAGVLRERMWVTRTALDALAPADREKARLLFRAYRAEIGLREARVEPDVEPFRRLFRSSP